MTRRLPLDADAISRAEAAIVLGVGEGSVARLRREGLLSEVRGGRRLYSRAEVKAFAADPWLNGVGAAQVLGVTRTRVFQLASADKIPFRFTRTGKRAFRKSQLQVVANARQTRSTRTIGVKTRNI